MHLYKNRLEDIMMPRTTNRRRSGNKTAEGTSALKRAALLRVLALIADWVLFAGWTVVGLLNFIFFVVHVSPVNLIGLFTGRSSISFAFMTVSAFIMLPISVIVAYCAARRRPLLEKLRQSPQWRVARLVLSAFAAFFIIVELNLVVASFPGAAPPTPEIIILGAHVSEDGLSATLHSRLTAGLAHANANPEARVIVSGGQGLDEPVSEAAAMRDYLVSQGLSADRILMEDNSHNTFENLINTLELLTVGDEPYPVTIVTSEFHIFRTAMLARRVGLEPHFVAARTPRSILLSSYSREFFGLIKSYFTDRL
ncbi:MAG: YdcF family protein [Oscillospiraceae bacterium]|nr:YdcF family protein [Oscillospiraceae bacterium]